MTLKYKVDEADSWSDEEAENVISYLKQRPWLQSDLDAVYEARGIDPNAAAKSSAGGTDYESMTKDELQDELSAKGLPTSGNKDELIARLQENG